MTLARFHTGKSDPLDICSFIHPTAEILTFSPICCNNSQTHVKFNGLLRQSLHAVLNRRLLTDR